MKISVLTITRNAELFFKETLVSVAAQTYPDVEHILWDGGSTDGTLAIAKSFPHLQVHQGSDSGISDALNKVAKLATGDLLCFLHADDLLAHPDVLSSVAAHAEGAGWLYGQAEMINEQGAHLRTTDHIPFSFKRLRKYNCITEPATFIRRDLYEAAGGWRTDLTYAMDYELWLRLASLAPAKSIPEVWAKFRQHQGSLSTREEGAVADEAYKVRNEYVTNLYERWRSYRTWKKRIRKPNLLVEEGGLS